MRSVTRFCSHFLVLLGLASGATTVPGCGSDETLVSKESHGGNSENGMLASSSSPHRQSELDVASSSQAPHPEFENWKQFPVGTLVTRRRVTTNKNGKVTVTTTLRLAAVTEQEVTVESRVSVLSNDGSVLDNDPMETSYPASFRIPPGLTAEQFSLPSFKAERVGEEMIQVADRSVSTLVYEWKEVNETGPMTVRVWFSREVPGRIARQELLTTETGTGSSEEIVQWDVPPVTEAR